MKKRLLSVLLCLGLATSLNAYGFIKGTNIISEAATVNQTALPEGVSGISAITKNFNVYHRIAALIIEYKTDIIAPGSTDAFEIIDTAMSAYNADEEKRESDRAVITSIYTNNVPDIKEDKTSSDGKYLILELQGNFPCVINEETNKYVIENVACMATWRRKGEDCQSIRNDWSGMTITQKVNLTDSLGNVVSPACVLPTLQPENVKNLIIDEFETKTFKTANGYDVYYHIYLPPNYDKHKNYPLIVHVAGGGSRVAYNFRDDNGNLLSLRGSLTADQVTTFWTECGEDVIVINPQIWKDEPKEWNCNYADDIISIVKYVKNEYSVDASRVYAIGSSFGTLQLSNVIKKEPELFTAYVMSNGSFEAIDNASDSILKTEVNRNCVFTPESLVNTIYANKADFSAYKDIAEEYWGNIADSDLKIYMIAGANDETGANIKATLGCITFKEILEQKGFSPAEIHDRLILNIVRDEDMLEKGICKFHSCSKYVVLDPAIVNWLLSQ